MVRPSGARARAEPAHGIGRLRSPDCISMIFYAGKFRNLRPGFLRAASLDERAL